jgi:hypothetical protein
MISGQNYVFDVQRTWREVYDSTRRKLMKEANTNLCREEEAVRGICSVDIGGMADHYCLNFLFIIDRFYQR